MILYNGLPKIHSLTHSFFCLFNERVYWEPIVYHTLGRQAWVSESGPVSAFPGLVPVEGTHTHTHTHTHTNTHMYTHTCTSGLFSFFKCPEHIPWFDPSSIELNNFLKFTGLKNQWTWLTYIWSVVFWQRYWSSSIGKGSFFNKRCWNKWKFIWIKPILTFISYCT